MPAPPGGPYVLRRRLEGLQGPCACMAAYQSRPRSATMRGARSARTQRRLSWPWRAWVGVALRPLAIGLGVWALSRSAARHRRPLLRLEESTRPTAAAQVVACLRPPGSSARFVQTAGQRSTGQRSTVDMRSGDRSMRAWPVSCGAPRTRSFRSGRLTGASLPSCNGKLQKLDVAGGPFVGLRLRGCLEAPGRLTIASPWESSPVLPPCPRRAGPSRR